MKSCMAMELSNWLRVNDQYECRNKMAKQFFIYNARIVEFKVWATYLFELKSNSQLECFQKLFDDCYSFTGPYGRCLNAKLGLKWPGSVCRSPTAILWSEFRIWSWCCYRLMMRAWITHMKCMECVWSGKLRYARVKWKFGS